MTPTGSRWESFIFRGREIEEGAPGGLGGFLGSMLRYRIGWLVGRMKAGWTFPLETLLINVSGCLVLGFLAGLNESRGVLSGSTRAFLFIGASRWFHDLFHLRVRDVPAPA